MVFAPKLRAPLEVIAPRVEAPALSAVAKRFVELAVVAKKFVVVADVPVAFRNVKFWRVEEARERNPPVRVESPVTESEPRVPIDVRDERVVTDEFM